MESEPPDCKKRLDEVDEAIERAFERMDKTKLVITNLTLEEIESMQDSSCAMKNEDFRGFSNCLTSALTESIFLRCFDRLQW